MIEIVVAPELWSTSIMPEGILEGWLVANGTIVNKGAAVAKVRIEDMLHELTAPAAGKLVIEAAKNDVIEPGTVIGHISPIAKSDH